MEKITINNLVIATFGSKEDYKLNKDTLPEGAITLVEDNGGSANVNELTEKINTLKTDIERDMSEYRAALDDLDNRLRAQKTELIKPLTEKIDTLETNINHDMSEFRGVFDDLDNRLRAQKTELINPLIEKFDTFKTKTERDISESQAAIMELDSKLSKQRTELVDLITEKIEAAKKELASKPIEDAEEKEY